MRLVRGCTRLVRMQRTIAAVLTFICLITTSVYGKARPVVTIGIESKIKVTTIRGPKPQFERVYETTVGDGFRIRVVMKTFIGDRGDYGSTVTQKNGRYIFFQANEVADKIIDRELYPLVQAAVDEILAIDRAYMATHPSEFTDEAGVTWKRVQK